MKRRLQHPFLSIGFKRPENGIFHLFFLQSIVQEVSADLFFFVLNRVLISNLSVALTDGFLFFLHVVAHSTLFLLTIPQ